MKRLLTAILSLVCIAVSAQETTNIIGIGSTSLLDTYLSPEHYSGMDLRLLHQKETPMKRLRGWSRTTTSQGYISVSSPRSEDANDLAALYQFSYGMHRHFSLSDDLSVAVGGQADAFLGAIYNTRNGNNPAQMKLGIDVAPAVKVSYRFRLFRKAMRLQYQGSLPLAGLQFSPAYGQSYYEIFSQGNYDHNACFTSPFNALSYANMLTVSIPLRKAAITFGYLGDYRQTKLNSLKYHSYTHSFVIGYTL